MPYWAVMWSQEPWGFRGLDLLTSKQALYSGRFRAGTSASDLMIPDPFEDYELSQEEFDELTAEEQNDYVDKQFRLMQMVLN